MVVIWQMERTDIIIPTVFEFREFVVCAKNWHCINTAEQTVQSQWRQWLQDTQQISKSYDVHSNRARAASRNSPVRN